MWTNCPLKVEIEDCIRKLENVHSKEKLQNQYIIIPTSQKIYFGLLQKKKKNNFSSYNPSAKSQSYKNTYPFYCIVPCDEEKSSSNNKITRYNLIFNIETEQ